LIIDKKGADYHNKMMLEKAWENTPLLHALEDVNIYPDISQDNLNIMLIKATRNGEVQTVEYVLKRGADVNHRPFLSSSEEEWHILSKHAYKRTPLIENAIQGFRYYSFDSYNKYKKLQISPQIAEILLKAGADPDITDSEGKTALHYTIGEHLFYYISDEDCFRVIKEAGLGKHMSGKKNNML